MLVDEVYLVFMQLCLGLIMHFVFHMFDTPFCIKYNSCKKMCLVVMYSGFLTYFFQQCNLFFLFLILYLCKI